MARDFALVLPAAGSGSRFGPADKLLVDLAGRSVLQRAVGLFAGHPAVGWLVVMTSRDRLEAYRDHLAGVAQGVPLLMVEGGQERYQSVMHGLRALVAVAEAPRYVAVHDAARPLTPRSVIDAAFAAARSHGAALPCLPEPATLKRRNADNTVGQTVDRKNLLQAQTPQCFDRARLLAAYEALAAAGKLGDLTDDAQVFERSGWPVYITAGSPLNLKLTTAEDAPLARAVLSLAQSG